MVTADVEVGQRGHSAANHDALQNNNQYKLDRTTRWAAVDCYTSACCDLYLRPFDLKA